MASIRLNTITADNELLYIKDGRVLITNTDLSINTNNGALVVKGGVGIYCTSDASSSTCGGAFTIGGGVGIKGKTYFGNDIILDSSLSTLTINGIVYPRLFLDSIVNKQFFLSLDGIHQQLLLTPSNLTLDTNVTINNSMNINTNINSSSVTCGGSLTVGGGGSVYGDFYIGESLFVSGGSIYTNEIFSENTLNVYTNDNLNFTTSKINIDSDVLNIKNNVIFLDENVNFNIPIISNENVNFKNKVLMEDDVTFLKNMDIRENLSVNNNIHVKKNIYLTNNYTNIYNYNDYIFFNANNGYVFESTSSSLSIYSGLLHLNNYSFFNENDNLNIISSLPQSYLNIYPKYNNNDDNLHDDNLDNLICLYNVNECFKIGYDSINKTNIISIESTSGNNTSDFVLKNKNGNFVLRTDGSLFSSSIKSSLNSTSASCVFDGGVSINSNVNASSVTEGGALTLNGGLSVLKDVHIGGDIYIGSNSMSIDMKCRSDINIANDLSLCYLNDDSDILFNIFKKNSDTTSLIDITLYSLGKSKADEDFEYLSINNFNKEFSICSMNNGYGLLQSIQIFTGDSRNQLFISTNGNIGINTNVPEFTLDVNGSINGDNLFGKNIHIEQHVECFDASIKNNMNIANDLFINHDISIQNDLLVDGLIYCKNDDENAFTIDGGVKIAKNINIDGSLISKSDGIFKNLITGELISDGEINIKCTSQSFSVTQGGALTVAGGVGVGGDVFINGKCHLYDTLNLRNCNLNNEIIRITDSYDVLRFAINYNSDGNLSISRHDLKNVMIDEVVTVVNTTGSVIFNNTMPSINVSTSSVIMKGGLSLECSENVMNISQGGSLTVAGGASIGKNMFIGGHVTILSTSQSNNMASGALVVNGGLGVMSNINIGGNAVINGDLIVKGNTTNISTENTSIKDNVFVLNSGPSGSHDSGLVVQRYQINNDKGKGDVVNDNFCVMDRLNHQAGITSPSNHVKLSYLMSNIDNYYVNWWIKVDTGFSANQVRQIIAYDGVTHIATLSAPWTNQNPANGDVVFLYNKPYVGMIFNERFGLFEFGSTVHDPASSNIIFTDNIGIKFNNGLCMSTSPSTSSSSGAFVLASGGLSINCADDAKNNTCGGSLTVAGGASINKSLYIGNDLYVNNVKMTPNVSDILSTVTYTALNDQLDIPFIVIDRSVLSFDIFLGVVVEMIDPVDNLYCNFNIRGINKKLSWEIETSFMGDDTGIEFDMIIDPITSNGIFRYSSPDYGTSISNIMFKYKMLTN